MYCCVLKCVLLYIKHINRIPFLFIICILIFISANHKPIIKNKKIKKRTNLYYKHMLCYYLLQKKTKKKLNKTNWLNWSNRTHGPEATGHMDQNQNKPFVSMMTFEQTLRSCIKNLEKKVIIIISNINDHFFFNNRLYLCKWRAAYL